MAIAAVSETRRIRRVDPRSGVAFRLAPEGVYVRQSTRHRLEYGPITYGRLLLIAARDFADAKRAEKQRERKAQRLERKRVK